MNTLSWMIYLGDVVAGLSVLMTLCGLFGSGAVIILLIVGNVEWTVWSGGVEQRRRNEDKQAVIIKWAKRGAIVFPIVLVTAAFLPSSRAIYMIAASETGEMIVNTPEAKELLGDLKEIIRKKLKDELVEKTGA